MWSSLSPANQITVGYGRPESFTRRRSASGASIIARAIIVRVPAKAFLSDWRPKLEVLTGRSTRSPINTEPSRIEDARKNELGVAALTDFYLQGVRSKLAALRHPVKFMEIPQLSCSRLP